MGRVPSLTEEKTSIICSTSSFISYQHFEYSKNFQPKQQKSELYFDCVSAKIELTVGRKRILLHWFVSNLNNITFGWEIRNHLSHEAGRLSTEFVQFLYLFSLIIEHCRQELKRKKM